MPNSASESDGAERSRSKDSVRSKSDTKSKSALNKLKDKNKKARSEIEALEKERITYRQEYEAVVAQNKVLIEENRSFKVIVEASQNRECSTANNKTVNDVMDTDAQFHVYLDRNKLKQTRQDNTNLTDEQYEGSHSSPLITSNQYSQLVDTEDIYPPLPKKIYKMPNATQSSIKLNIKAGSLTKKMIIDPSKASSPSSSSSNVPTSKPKDAQADIDASAGINAQNTSKTNKVRPPPPIVCYDLDTKAAYTQFKEVLGHSNFDLDGPHGNITYVRTHTRADYDIVKAAAAVSQLDHHLYTPHDERIINVLLFRMCSSYNANDIATGINELGLDITLHNVMRFESEKSRMEHPSRIIWLIQLAPGSDVTALLKTKILLCQSNINFERRKNNGIVQCKNCQHFGHTAINCARQFRCVKCQLSHGPKECPTDAADRNSPERKTPSCVNCGGLDHPANFRGCPSYKALIQRKQARILEQQKQQELRQQYISNYRKEGISYSKVSKGNNQNIGPAVQKNNSNIDTNPFDYLQQECLRLFNNDLFTIMDKCKEFVPRHKLITDRKQQTISVLNFISSITN